MVEQKELKREQRMAVKRAEMKVDRKGLKKEFQ
jgi:hypothetical protein